jgi:hypothetical protein
MQATVRLRSDHVNLRRYDLLLVNGNNDVFLLKKIKFGCPLPDTIIAFLGAVEYNMNKNGYERSTSRTFSWKVSCKRMN